MRFEILLVTVAAAAVILCGGLPAHGATFTNTTECQSCVTQVADEGNVAVVLTGYGSRRRGLARSFPFSLAPFVSAYLANIAACANLSSTFSQPLRPVLHASVPSGYCASIWADFDINSEVRGLLALPGNRGLLVLQRGPPFNIWWLNDTDGSGAVNMTNTQEAVILLNSLAQQLNHNMDIWFNSTSGHWMLIASSETTVYAWQYDVMNGPRVPLNVSTQIVLVRQMSTGFHVTRTVRVGQSTNSLYVSEGSGANAILDAGPSQSQPYRAMIKRYNLLTVPAAGYVSYSTDGVVWANGVRNVVGMHFDSYGVLWGVENGADQLDRDDLGGLAAHEQNPGEEVHKYVVNGTFYGYPYCWSEYALNSSKAIGRGGQWYWPSARQPDPTFFNPHQDDAWCRNPNNNYPPVGLMEAHAAPLGMMFYPTAMYAGAPANVTFPNGEPGTSVHRASQAPKYAFPPSSTGDYLYVTQHGSTDPGVPYHGYRVVRFPTQDLGAANGGVSLAGEAEPFMIYLDPSAPARPQSRQFNSDWGVRPVDLAIGAQGELYVSNDYNTSVYVIRYLDVTPPAPGSSSSTGSYVGLISSTAVAPASSSSAAAPSSTSQGGPVSSTGSAVAPSGLSSSSLSGAASTGNDTNTDDFSTASSSSLSTSTKVTIIAVSVCIGVPLLVALVYAAWRHWRRGVVVLTFVSPLGSPGAPETGRDPSQAPEMELIPGPSSTTGGPAAPPTWMTSVNK